jgi:hypothetical protein
MLKKFLNLESLTFNPLQGVQENKEDGTDYRIKLKTMDDKFVDALRLAPIKFVFEKASELKSNIFFRKGNNYKTGNFCWVYGLYDTEIKDFSIQYNSSIIEIENMINNIEDERLKIKMNKELELLPSLDYNEFTIESNNILWIISPLYILRKFKKTNRFNNLLDNIKFCCERMINYYENSEWLILENKYNSGL